jgi:hypothetical protein
LILLLALGPKGVQFRETSSEKRLTDGGPLHSAELGGMVAKLMDGAILSYESMTYIKQSRR